MIDLPVPVYASFPADSVEIEGRIFLLRGRFRFRQMPVQSNPKLSLTWNTPIRELKPSC